LDRRGIDNAIIYDSTTLTLEEHGVVRFEMPNPKYPSRDILWAKFSKGKETFYTMVNHWPSRWGGQEKSEPKRLVAANAAKKFIDSLHTVDKNVQIVFMGDLNDYPTNTAPKLIMETLCPMISPASGEMGGTHSYRGEWGVLDHIMVSKGLGKKKGISVVKGSGAIHNYDFIMTEYKGNIVPFRTYGGGKYLAGYSDHLPVTISVKL
jgi:predicted extracellular nuclease